ncbi:unnamed protein product [Scytosiphon promiscuus]
MVSRAELVLCDANLTGSEGSARFFTCFISGPPSTPRASHQGTEITRQHLASNGDDNGVVFPEPTYHAFEQAPERIPSLSPTADRASERDIVFMPRITICSSTPLSDPDARVGETIDDEPVPLPNDIFAAFVGRRAVVSLPGA